MEKIPQILTPKTTYTMDYPQAVEFANTQMDVFWHPNEIEVEKDLHDLRTNFTEAELHGVVTTLKLFTLYETVIGKEYWGNCVAKMFPRPDIERMANAFSFMEINVHAPFYNKLNEVLGLDTDEFYNSYVDDPVLKERMDWIGEVVSKPTDTNFDKLAALGIFSIIEGAVLYSNFAFLKSFSVEGKNKLVHVTSGINFSVRDENLHSEGGAWLYTTLLNECKQMGLISSADIKKLEEYIIKVCAFILDHECRIIDMIFEKGAIKGITDTQLKHFVESRLDLCLTQLNIEKQYKPTYNPIKDWFYKNINSAKMHDFFQKMGSEYNRNWKELNFKW